MLILTRKPDEGIVIGDDVLIVMAGHEGDEVTLEIYAPADIRITPIDEPAATAPPGKHLAHKPEAL